MAAYLATAVPWVAAATRVRATVRRPDPGRVSMTAGAVCVACRPALSGGLRFLPGLLPGRDCKDLSAARVHLKGRVQVGSLFFVASGCRVRGGDCLRRRRGMLLRYSTGSPLLFLGSVNIVSIALAGILAGIGILAPIPVDGLLRWRRARRTCGHLHGLWAALTRAVPDVVLPMPSVRSPLDRVELTSTRRRIEIADALGRIRVDERDAAVIQRSDDPPAALGQALRDASRWAPSGRVRGPVNMKLSRSTMRTADRFGLPEVGPCRVTSWNSPSYRERGSTVRRPQVPLQS